MELVERQVIKPNHRFYPEADRLFLLAKNLDNSANYIYRQNFFRQPINALAVDRPLNSSVNHKALPAKETQNTLRLMQKAWTSYYQSVTLALALALAQLNFKQHRKSIRHKNSRKKDRRGASSCIWLSSGQQKGFSQRICQLVGD